MCKVIGVISAKVRIHYLCFRGSTIDVEKENFLKGEKYSFCLKVRCFLLEKDDLMKG